MQAARGTSIDEGAPDDRRPRFHPRVWLIFASTAGLLYAVDQFTKHLAIERLSGSDDVAFIGEILQFHLTRNPGAAFSLGTEFTIALTCLAIAASCVVLWLSRRVATVGWAIALGMLLAGITGNLSDRLLREPAPFRGHVIDFLMLPNWPIFNVADICINVGAALILIQVFRGIRMDGTRVPADAAEGEST